MGSSSPTPTTRWSPEGTGLTALLLGYGAARTAHSYVAGVQPWRTASFGVGLTIQLVVTGWSGLLTIGS